MERTQDVGKKRDFSMLTVHPQNQPQGVWAAARVPCERAGLSARLSASVRWACPACPVGGPLVCAARPAAAPFAMTQALQVLARALSHARVRHKLPPWERASAATPQKRAMPTFPCFVKVGFARRCEARARARCARRAGGGAGASLTSGHALGARVGAVGVPCIALWGVPLCTPHGLRQRHSL